MKTTKYMKLVGLLATAAVGLTLASCGGGGGGGGGGSKAPANGGANNGGTNDGGNVVVGLAPTNLAGKKLSTVATRSNGTTFPIEIEFSNGGKILFADHGGYALVYGEYTYTRNGNGATIVVSYRNDTVTKSWRNTYILNFGTPQTATGTLTSYEYTNGNNAGTIACNVVVSLY